MYLMSAVWILWSGIVGFLGFLALVLIWWHDVGFPNVRALLRGTTYADEAKARIKAEMDVIDARHRQEDEEAREAVVRQAWKRELLAKKGGLARLIMVNGLKHTRAWEAAGKPADWPNYIDRRAFKPLVGSDRVCAEEWENDQKAAGVWVSGIDDERYFDEVADWMRYDSRARRIERELGV